MSGGKGKKRGPRPDEVKAKIAAGKAGKRPSQEARLNMGKAQRRRWALWRQKKADGQ